MVERVFPKLTLIAWLGVVGCAEVGELSSDEQPVASSSNAATDDQPSCTLEDDKPPLLMRVDAGFHIAAGESGTLPIAIDNSHGSSGALSLTAHIFSARQAATVSLGEIALAANQAEIEVPIQTLALDSGDLDFSGSIHIRGKIAYEDGLEIGVAGLTLFFHPEQGQWAIYDRLARDTAHDGGALTQAARDLRAEAMSAEPQAVFAGAARMTPLSRDPAHVPEPAEDR